MAAEKAQAGIWLRLKDLLIREDWICLLSLLAHLLAYNVALKVVRVVTRFGVPLRAAARLLWRNHGSSLRPVTGQGVTHALDLFA